VYFIRTNNVPEIGSLDTDGASGRKVSTDSAGASSRLIPVPTELPIEMQRGGTPLDDPMEVGDVDAGGGTYAQL